MCGGYTIHVYVVVWGLHGVICQLLALYGVLCGLWGISCGMYSARRSVGGFLDSQMFYGLRGVCLCTGECKWCFLILTQSSNVKHNLLLKFVFH